MSPLRVAAIFGAFGVLCVGGMVAFALRVQPEQLAAPEAAKSASKGAVSQLKTPKLPAEKACLPPPTDAAEDEMVASAGLDSDAVRTVMRAAAQSALRCFQGSPSVTMVLDLNVACTGRVASVGISDDGGAPSLTQTCLKEALRYAEFPAHGLPDGESFEYPLSYNAPE